MKKNEGQFLDEITKREKLTKNIQQLFIFSNVVGTGFSATAVITGCVSIPAFASDWGLPIGVVLCSMNIFILLLLENAASQKLRQLFAVKQKKHNLIEWFAQTKLDAL